MLSKKKKKVKEKVCLVLKFWTRVGGVGGVTAITPSADPDPLSACDLHSRGDDDAIILLLEMAN